MKLLTENLLYHIWDQQKFIAELKSITKSKVIIVYPGQRNSFEGPDFINAVFKIDNKIIKGDIEIHKNSKDWYYHKHQENPKFNTVELHVVYNHDDQQNYTLSKNGKQIPILEMKNFVSEQDINLNQELPFQYSDKYCNLFTGLNKAKTEMVLLHFGKRRFEIKKTRYDSELLFTDFNQLLLIGFSEAFGYSKNKKQMVKVAEHFSFQYLQSLFYEHKSKDYLIALILGSSNLLEFIPKSIDDEMKSKWTNIFVQIENPPQLMIEWNLFRIRPANHPVVRIIQLIDLMYDNFEISLFNKTLQLFSFTEDSFKISELKKKLYQLFRNKNMMLPEKLKIGKSRIDTLFVNIILPITYLYADKMSYPKLKEVVQKIYLEYPPLSKNNKLTKMYQFIDESQKKLSRKSTIYQQGLLEIWAEYCQYHQCDLCIKNMKQLPPIN